MSPAVYGRRAAFPLFFAVTTVFVAALASLLFWPTVSEAQGQRRGPARILSAPARAMPARPPARVRPIRVQRPVGGRRVIRTPQRNRPAATGVPRRLGRIARPGFRPGFLSGNRAGVRPGFRAGSRRQGLGRPGFGRHRFGRRGLHAGLVGPQVIPYQGPAEIPAPAVHPYVDEPSPYRAYRYRCVAPKIIKVGPITRQPGPGPRLVYGARNPCGSPAFVDATNPKVLRFKR